MGFGLNGRFDLNGPVEVISYEDLDVVALSEVDRAWLLNGGHDTLALLARRLDMTYRSPPAADAVWGDAVLTRLPILDVRTLRLSAVGAPTGAPTLPTDPPHRPSPPTLPTDPPHRPSPPTLPS